MLLKIFPSLIKSPLQFLCVFPFFVFFLIFPVFCCRFYFFSSFLSFCLPLPLLFRFVTFFFLAFSSSFSFSLSLAAPLDSDSKLLQTVVEYFSSFFSLSFCLPLLPNFSHFSLFPSLSSAFFYAFFPPMKLPGVTKGQRRPTRTSFLISGINQDYTRISAAKDKTRTPKGPPSSCLPISSDASFSNFF